MINYYVIKVDSDCFEVRRDLSNMQNYSYYGLSNYEVIDAFYDEHDAYAYAFYLENRDAVQSE